jgi:uncharacterized membrane protein YgcG
MQALLLLLLAVLAVPAALAAERIEYFQSDLQVLSDGSMEVIETIVVQAEGRAIKRGIYRDFPTVYRDRFNNRVKVRFDVVTVRRNQQPEPWFTEDRATGVRLYIGNENVRIPSGVHSFEITYRTDRQLGFFAEHDELYWNVTGNEWAFPIDEVMAYVYLPRTVPAVGIGVEAYTGPSGARGADFEAGIDDKGVVWFRTTRKLAVNEGLTIVTTWPKGHVREPTSRERLEWFLHDNGQIVAALVGALLLLAYYLVMWTRVGRDPPPGVIFPRYEPPAGYSPAAMRFIRRMAYDDKAFTAALVNLAAKGHLRIVETSQRFVIEKSESQQPLAPGEKAIRDRLFATGPSLDIVQAEHATLRSAIAAHEARLEADYERKYFTHNVGPTLFGLALSLLVLGAVLLWSPDVAQIAPTAFMTVWLSVWSFAVFALLSKVIHAWRGAHGVGGHGAAIAISLFTVPFVLGWFAGAYMLMQLGAAGILVAILSLVGINFLFYHLMKAPTLQGRRLLDDIDGFYEYLALAESDELRLRNPPRKTPELFERLLPYAIALDVEQVWGARFERVIAAAQRTQGYTGPRWYGGGGHVAPGRLAQSMGSALAGSIASSAQAPGSSSGSGGSGGGSSGGGGGGGGGGGW